MSRKVYRVSRAGSLNNPKLIEETFHEPAPDEVAVDVKAIGLNFADLFAIQGLYSATPKGSFIPGLEYAGRIAALGSDVKDFKVGDRIMGVTKFGAYASRLNIDHRYITKLPDDWSFEEGASYIVQALTAFYALVDLGNIKDNYSVLINSAAGGVGIYSNRIAKKFNAFTIGTVGSESKVEFLKSEGYDEVIVRDNEFSNNLKNVINDIELNIVLDSIGGRVFTESLKLLSPTGRIIVYGAAQFMSHSARPNHFKLLLKYLNRPKLDPLSLVDGNKSVMGFNLIYLWEKGELHELLYRLSKLHLEKPYIGHTFSFDDLPSALKLFQSGNTIGKVVIKL
ncbi:zinc-binding dehydrogenase [Bacteroidota bacterium]